MQDVAIDLGEARHDDDLLDRPTRRPPQRWRALLVVVAVLGAATLTGSVAPVEPTPVTQIPAALGDVTFLADHEYFVISTAVTPGDPVNHKIVNRYALPGGNLLSRTAVMVNGAIQQALAVDGVVMVTYELDDDGAEATAAYTVGTGRAAWRRNGRLSGVTSSHDAVVLHGVAGQSMSQWSGIDVHTGALRWQFALPLTDGDAEERIAGAGAIADRLVSLGGSGRLEVRSLDTGGILAASTISTSADPRTRAYYIGVASGLIMVRKSSDTIAFDLSDLHERWRTRIDLSSSLLQPDCGHLVCFHNPSGMQVFDPVDGRLSWTTDTWVDAQSAGKVLLASTPDDPSLAPVLTALDPADGRQLGTIGGWRPAGGVRADGHLPVLREQVELRQVWYGLLDPTTLGVRVLGVAEQVSGTCESTSDALVCRRTDASSGVWPFVSP